MVRALAAAGFLVLADKGYVGAGPHVTTPYKAGRECQVNGSVAVSVVAEGVSPSR